MFVSKVRKSFVFALSVFLYFSFLFSTVQAKTGKLIPLPIQESIVLFAVDGKQIFCVTEHTVLVESKGVFVAQYTSAPLITAACIAQGRIWLGTQSGLITLDKTTFQVSPVVVPGGATIRTFSDGKDKVWIGTDEYGLYSMVDVKYKKEASYQNIQTGWVVNNTMVVRTTDSLCYYRHARWFEAPKASYLVETAEDSLQRAFVDNNGLFWVVTAGHTSVFSLTGDTAQPLKRELQMQNNGMLLVDYLYVPTLGFLWSTSRGLYTHHHNNEANPIAGQSYEAVSNILGKEITEDFCRVTGFRSAERLYLNPDGKSIWLVNWNGALQVELKQMQSFF